jgi:hypothetical protein
VSTSSIDTRELAAMATPIRAELAKTRVQVVQALGDLRAAVTDNERRTALNRLAPVRARRDAYKRLLFAIQAVIDLESTPKPQDGAL